MSQHCCPRCAYPDFQRLSKWQADQTFAVHIDSRTRSSDDTPTDFTIQTPTNVQGQRIAMVRLTTLEMNNRWFNVSGGQTMDFVESGTAATNRVATIPPGEYTSTTLAAAVKSEMEAASSLTYTVTADDTLETFSIKPSSGTVAINWASGPNATVQESGAIDANHLYSILGFSKADVATSATVTSDLRYNLNLPGYFYLTINALAPMDPGFGATVPQRMETELHKTNFRIPLSVPYGEPLSAESTRKLVWYNEGLVPGKSSSSTWRIRLLDPTLRDAGTYSSFVNQDWSATLTLYSIPDDWPSQPWANFSHAQNAMETA
jgi:hypothetical protein